MLGKLRFHKGGLTIWEYAILNHHVSFPLALQVARYCTLHCTTDMARMAAASARCTLDSGVFPRGCSAMPSHAQAFATLPHAPLNLINAPALAAF